MEKNKMFYITLVLVICLVLTGLGAFYLGTEFGKKEIVNNKDNKKEDTSYVEELLNMDINDLTKTGLYNYSESGKSSLEEYFDSLNNSQKLDLAGLSLKNTTSIDDLKQNLIYAFGSDLGIESKDFYLSGDDIPMYFYDTSVNKFIYNDDYPGTDMVTNLGGASLYNYRLKDIEKDGDDYIVSYYGLYETNMFALGPTWLTNGKNIDRPNVDNPINYGANDNTPIDYYLANIFNNNKNDFLIFDYTFNEKNGNYYIVDFKVR